jgi:hypothetical protein
MSIYYYNTQELLGRTNHLLSFDMTWTAQKTKKIWGYTDRHTDSKVIAYASLIRHGPHRKTKKNSGIHKQQGDLVSLVTQIGGDKLTDR